MKAARPLSIGRSILSALLLSALLVALTAGCAGHSATPGGLSPLSGQPDPAPVQGLTDAGGRPLLPLSDCIPANASRYHEISAAQVGINGIDYSDQAGTNNYDLPADHALVIQPGGEDDLLAYAMYALTDLNTERPVKADFSIAAAPIQPGGEEDLPLSFWVGISDFTTYSWEWHGPYTSPDDAVNVDLNELVGGQDIRDRYISASNVLYMVVLTEAGPEFVGPGNPLGLTAARINLLTVDKLTVGELGYRSTRPHFPLIESIGVGGAAAAAAKQAAALDPSQYVTLTWTHVFDSSDPDAEAIQYKVYRKGPDDASMIPIGSVNAPEQQYIDPTDNASWVPEVVPGATYTYYLRAYNNAGFTPFSSAEYVIPLLGPTDLQASDGAFMDKIALTWTKAEAGTGYKVYRDGQAETDVIATLGDVDTYDDTGVTDFDPHTYWVRGTSQYAPEGGEFSAPDTGYQANNNPSPIVITGMEVEITGATGGAGPLGTLFTDGDTAAAVANGHLLRSVVGIFGTYNAAPFTPADYGGLVPVPEYDAAMAELLNVLGMTVSNAGAPGIRYAANVIDFLTVFPDDDPESDAASPEGWLDVTAAQSGSLIPAPITCTIGIDVTADPEAATFSDYLLNGSDTETEIPRPAGSDFVVNLDWGGADPTVIDLTTTQFQMLLLPATGICDPAATSTIDFSYEDFVPSPPDPSPTLDGGEFTIEDHGGGVFQIHAIIPGMFLLVDSQYIFRFHNTLKWSSLNRPDWTFFTVPPPPPPALINVPEHLGTGSKFDNLQIYIEDPIIHRWSGAEPDPLTGTINYKGHEVDFSDELKTSGSEILLEAQEGVGVWPSVVIVDGDVDPAGITYNDARNMTGYFNMVRHEIGRIVVDVVPIPRPIDIGDPTWTYTYATFSRSQMQTGYGQFTTEFIDPVWDTLADVDWGVNAWNREPGAYGSQDYSNKTLDGNTVGTTTPDVLWFEFNGGYLNDFNYGIDEDTLNNNIRIIVEDLSDSNTMAIPILLKIAGIGPTGNCIAIHSVSAQDFYNIWAPLDPGIFEVGHDYSVTLDDPNGSGLQRTYVDTLTVIGTNPND